MVPNNYIDRIMVRKIKTNPMEHSVFLFWQRTRVLTKNTCSDKKHVFWQRTRVLAKYTCSDKVHVFLYKVHVFWQRTRVLTKITCSDKVHLFWQRMSLYHNRNEVWRNLQLAAHGLEFSYNEKFYHTEIWWKQRWLLSNIYWDPAFNDILYFTTKLILNIWERNN